jgi:uncharacterized protein YceK
MKRKITLLLFCILALVGCSSIDSGTITKKIYSAPYESTSYQCMTRNKDGICAVNMPVKQYHSASYRFDIKNGDKTGWVYVNEHDYNSRNVGDCWSC